VKLKFDTAHIIHLKGFLTELICKNLEFPLYLQQNQCIMKKVLLILSIICFAFSCEKQEPLAPDTYEITVVAKGVINGLRSHIKIVDDGKKAAIIDTAIVMNETFTFTGSIKNPAIRVISVNSVNGSLPFVLEPGRITIELYKDSIVSSKITGTDNNDDYNLFKTAYLKRNTEISEIRKKAIAAKRSNDFDLFNELVIEDDNLTEALNQYAHDFIAEHPKSQLSLLLLESQIIGKTQDVEKFKSSLALLQNVVNRNATNKLLGQKIATFIILKEAQSNLDIGKIAPDFSAPAPNGEMIALNDIKGKVTIIDFWAAWCGPCRRENPNVVKVYEKYHDKGLEIISISLDGSGRQKDPKAAWLKAIDDDNLTWHHVSNLKYFNEPVARLYNINSIPATFILDENGKIVAKKLRGPALERKISDLLD